jgi:hypothetical protein
MFKIMLEHCSNLWPYPKMNNVHKMTIAGKSKMFNLSTLTVHASHGASFGLDQRIGTGPFSFLFDAGLLSAVANQASVIYCGVVLVVMATAALASTAEKHMIN